MKTLIFTSLLIFLGIFAEALEKKEIPTPMTTSIIVPCHFKHFKLIPELLNRYEQQTVLPDEVVIALTINQCGRITFAEVEDVLNTPWKFDVKIVYDHAEYPGMSRNCACAASKGDLLICQDADDVPHPQRTEILKTLFENYHVDLLIHRWMHDDQSFVLTSTEEALQKASYFKNYDDISFDFIHNGNVALTKEVFKEVKWPDYSLGEDVAFHQWVFKKFEYKVGVDQYLIIYRNELSSYKDR